MKSTTEDEIDVSYFTYCVRFSRLCFLFLQFFLLVFVHFSSVQTSATVNKLKGCLGRLKVIVDSPSQLLCSWLRKKKNLT